MASLLHNHFCCSCQFEQVEALETLVAALGSNQSLLNSVERYATVLEVLVVNVDHLDQVQDKSLVEKLGVVCPGLGVPAQGIGHYANLKDFVYECLDVVGWVLKIRPEWASA